MLDTTEELIHYSDYLLYSALLMTLTPLSRYIYLNLLVHSQINVDIPLSNLAPFVVQESTRSGYEYIRIQRSVISRSPLRYCTEVQIKTKATE